MNESARSIADEKNRVNKIDLNEYENSYRKAKKAIEKIVQMIIMFAIMKNLIM